MRNIVGKVGDHRSGPVGLAERGQGYRHGVLLDDGKSAGIGVAQHRQGLDGARIALDSDDFMCAAFEERARQPSGTGADFNHGLSVELSGFTGDTARYVQVEQKMLAQRPACANTIARDDLTQRRQNVRPGAILRHWQPGRRIECGDPPSAGPGPTPPSGCADWRGRCRRYRRRCRDRARSGQSESRA